MVSRMPLIKRYLKDCDNLEFRILGKSDKAKGISYFRLIKPVKL